MTPGAFAVAVAIVVALGHLARWLLDRGALTSAPAIDNSDGSAPSLDDVPAAITAYVLSGADGAPCRVLDCSATATAAELVARESLSIVERNGDDIVLTINSAPTATPTFAHQDLVMAHVRSRAWRPNRDTDRPPVVSTGTLASHPPGRLWWARFRSAVAIEAERSGLTRRRVAPALPRALIVFGAIAAGLGSIDTVSALVARQLGQLSVWWILIAVAGARLALSSTWMLLERSDLLTHRGRSFAVIAARAADDLAHQTDPSTDVARNGRIPLAIALGVTTRAERQVPLTSNDGARRVWSRASGTSRMVTIRRRPMPAEGARPGRVAIGGLLALLTGIVTRSTVVSVRASDWVAELDASVPDAFGPLDRHLDVIAGLALIPIVLGVAAIAVGLVDLVVTAETRGMVVDVRLPDSAGIAARVRSAAAGLGHDATAVVELAVDDGTKQIVYSLLVDARAAAPVGATVVVRRTAILHRVRSVGPIGSSGATTSPSPSLGA